MWLKYLIHLYETASNFDGNKIVTLMYVQIR